MASADPTERSEVVDEDKLGGDYPPERPLGADEYGTAPAEERVPEPLEERVRRERPDVPERDRREVGELVDPVTVETPPPDGRAEAIEGELVDKDQPSRLSTRPALT
jgi:hypothetical protein